MVKWILTASGIFTVKFAVKELRDHSLPVNWSRLVMKSKAVISDFILRLLFVNS